MRSRLLHIKGNLNSNCYIMEVLQPEVLTPPSGNSTCHISAGKCLATLGKDCASLPKMMGITASLAGMFTRHVAHQICLGYGWSATYSSGFSSTTLDALWTCIQTAWRDIPEEDIQGIFDSMSQCIEILIAAHEGFTPY